MIAIIFNAVAYISVLLANWGRKKPLNIYSYLLLIWAISSVLGYFTYLLDPLKWGEAAIWPFVYLLVVFLIFIRPFKSFSVRTEDLEACDNFSLRVIAWIYAITGILSIIYTLPYAIANFTLADWNALRDEIYMDDDTVVLYHSAFERIVKNIHSYTSAFGTVYLFFLLTKPKSNKLLIILLLVSWIGSSFVSSALEAGRGMIVRQLMNAGLLYVIFRNRISAKSKRWLGVFFIVMAVFISSYLVAVTVSRFGSGDSGSNSTVFYLGHSMLNFNTGIAQSIQNFAGGKRFFKWFIDFFGGNSGYGNLGHQAGSGFVTFIGNFYMDFGAFGTLALALLMMFVLRQFTKKSKVKISDMAVIVFFADYYLNGIFVYAPGTSLQWFFAFVLYFIIKGLETNISNNYLYARH